MESKNECRIEDGVVYLTLTQGQVATVDEADLPLIAKHRWFAHKQTRTWYAVTNIRKDDGTRTVLRMHRLLCPTELQVDHIDGDGLNNTRGNLRAVTRQTNNRNRQRNANSASGFKGVYWHKGARKWRADIRHNGRMKYLGLFDSAIVAAQCFDRAAIELRGDDATPRALNFPVVT
jgi:HNH endonuclease